MVGSKELNVERIMREGSLKLSMFQQNRNYALEITSNLEIAQSQILSLALGISFLDASIIYHSVGNSRARLVMIESLIKRNFSELKKPWNVMMDWLNNLNGQRNKIVHWQSKQHHNQDGKLTAITLQQPKAPFSDSESHTFTEEQLQQYRTQANTLYLILIEYTSCFAPENPNYSARRKVFSQLTGDQNPNTLLQSLISTEPQNQPQS